MSCGGGGEKEGRGSRRPSPLRATLPIQAMHRTSPLRLRNRISPDTEITPGLDLLSTATPTKGRLGGRCGRGGGGPGGGGGGGVLMRRTASLDTIYLKGPCWHNNKDQQQQQQQQFTHILHLDKASQTPEEWISICYGSVGLGCNAAAAAGGLDETAASLSPCSNNSSNSNSRRPSVSVVTPSSPWLPAGNTTTATTTTTTNNNNNNNNQPPPPPTEEQLEKFIRHRLQRTNKEGSGGGGGVGVSGGGGGGGGGLLRYSPVHADHSVLTPSIRHHHHHHHHHQHAIQQTNGGSRGGVSIPHLPKPLLPPRLRSSVEGLNQEIERLVLRPSHMSGEELDDVWCSSEVGRDGRRAPIAEYLRFTRSVDTQTPARGSAVSTSSDHTSPSLSPTTSPPHVLGPDPSRPSSTPSPTATTTTLHPLATSPHINKFLAREPPDGCERVALKHYEDRSGVSKSSEWPAVRPPGGFTLRASQGSAFCAPERIAAAAAADSSTSLCGHQTEPGSVYCAVCAVESSDSPEPELAQCLPPELAQCPPTMTHHPLTCDATTTTTAELTADQ